ncbi:RICIN domain-containing protein [Glycomyces harbinensis]|uniref:Glycosyl hydrolases family 43 n=1 Tax=Glycomyces harbinensis TaxID=58114 RepID=A0A1G7DEJ9_9ACTN|nr:RICIN domain-containing protein [Glycomyces harbinensis]SDE49436.1 Glycosyl hydrolases family 43 [Glycomyces harbinensis]
MRTAWKAAFVCAAASLLLALGVAPAQAAPQTFDNGGPITTTNGSPMHAHGGGVIKEGDYYYMVGEQRRSGSSLFQAVSMYRSTDMVNWTHANDILTRDSHPELDPANIERPKVVYNAEFDHYVMWAHKENGSDYGDAEVAVAVSDTIDGDYTYRGSFRPLGHMSRDSTVFVDTDGTAYLISAARENYDLHIYRLSDDYLSVEALVHQFVGDHREAPAVFKRGGTYFLITSGATGWNPNQTKYATTANFASGSWSGWQNLGNATTYESQSTYVLEIAGSQTTSYLYMGDRWAGAWGGTPNESGYVWLPLRFPSNSTLALDWHAQITIDTATGQVTGSGGGGQVADVVNRNSGKCLDVVNGSTANGAEIIQYDCHGGTNQQWQLTATGGGYYRIASQSSGKCLDVDGASTANNARVIQWTCGSGTNQQWQLRTIGGYVEIVARHSGKCLDVVSSSTANSARLQQYDCYGGTNQQWTV